MNTDWGGGGSLPRTDFRLVALPWPSQRKRRRNSDRARLAVRISANIARTREPITRPNDGVRRGQESRVARVCFSCVVDARGPEVVSAATTYTCKLSLIQ
jgi:hypothetical protein